MRTLRTGAVALLLLSCGCARQQVPPATAAATPESADEFVARVNHCGW